ncbi:MAG: TRAM domain-containing protein [Treponema sp.]|jgi:23S rRNA (uracil1939-C5)-methyltransferase|nr:TRAM domain-containing protein [Treponema sp.]
MIPGEIISAEVEKIVPGGAGMARYEGQAVFIPHTVPGERVRARVRRSHKGWAEAGLLDLAEASPRRVKPRCPLAGREGRGCGGCSLQHLDYRFQLEVKTGILRETFGRLSGIPAALRLEALENISVFPSPPWEYRNRVQLHAAGKNPVSGKAGVGFMSSSGDRAGDGAEHRVIPAADCPVADPGIRSLLASGELEAPAGRFTLYSRGGMVLREGERGRVRIRDRELLMEAGLFFQSNAVMLEALAGDLVSIAGRADSSLPLADLYCGVGTFAAFLSGRFPRTDLLEENRAALALARQNVDPGDRNFFALTDNEWVKMKEAEGPSGAPAYGFIVADPPRQGLSPPMRRWLARGPAPLLAYVSCDPATLARDSGELVKGAWELEKLIYYDFYPQTAHIEGLALFRNKHA